MTKRVPIEAVKQVGRTHGLSQVILLGWDGKRTHVVTWGKSVEDCDQAAFGGDLVKKALGWPESLMGDRPSRVKNMETRIAELEKALVDKDE